MTDDTTPETANFAAFEALATAAEPKPAETQPETEIVAEPKAEDAPADEAPADEAPKDETDGDEPKDDRVAAGSLGVTA